MKKNAIKMVVLAIVVSAMLSSCEKDTSLAKDYPMAINCANENIWPDGALAIGNDTTWRVGIQELHGLTRIDSLLCIYYDTNEIDLPNGFCSILPVQSGGGEVAVRRGVVVLFGDRSRSVAIEELKGIENVYAIEPVYGDGGNSLIVATPRIQVMLNDISDTANLYNITDSLKLHYEFGGSGAAPIIILYTHYSLVNSIAASNIIVDNCSGYIKGIIPNMAITRLRDK